MKTGIQTPGLDSCFRRNDFFVIPLLVFALILLSPATVLPNPSLPHDGFIRLYHSHTKEFMEIRYEVNGEPENDALKKINHFMRSRDSGRERPMDLELIRLFDHLQDHFGADTIEIISGYRSPEFNRYLKSIGRSVVKNSHHLAGLAADFHLDEIREKTLKKYLDRIWQGGVGYYPDNLMLHVDVGPYRRWQQGKFSDRRDVGVFNEKVSLKLTTDHLFYRRGQKIKLNLVHPEKLSLKLNLRLEHFFRGKWIEVKTIPFPSKLVLPISDSLFRYGKMRWKIFTEDGQWQHSNEFYLKRQ